ncbi:sugar phosphate exchanger 3-like [Hydra vulgaris]|uniref:Sugar phosphate exchanger 3 n=1 Tax=Hydra vulgaris TaxID=6087 RepID=A0ABM4CDY3_HYDVU
MILVFKETLANIRKWTWHHVLVFILTFFLYACLHACRNAFSNIKNVLAKSLSPQNWTDSLYPCNTWQKEHMISNLNDANEFLGMLDTLYMLAYSIGLFISGTMGDRLNLRIMLVFGMCGSSITTFLFGYLIDALNSHKKFYYYGLFFLNGLLQSTGRPATVAILGNWFSKSLGGVLYGLWGTNASVGNIVGSSIVSVTISYGYPIGMLINSCLLFCGGVIVYICLITHPNQVGLDKWDERDLSRKLLNNDGKFQKKKAIGLIEAFFIPDVLPYALCYACIKMVNYIFFFWLPLYLTQQLKWVDEKSAVLSGFYDIGGIIGGIVAGIITDMINMRSPVICIMLLLSTGSLYFYGKADGTYYTNVSLMVATGFFIGGPDNIISTAITVDLGKHDEIINNAEALATVTGIIDGTGSFGAAVGQFLVPVISKHYNWNLVFYFLIVMVGCSFLCILPILRKDIKSMKNRKKESFNQTSI